MQTENWKNIKAVLMEALNLDASERHGFLEKADISSEVRQEVESLLTYEEESEDLMNLSAVEFSKDFFDEDAKSTLIGQRVGVYEIAGELGQGGIGAVYLAARNDGKFEQKVAIKMLKGSLMSGKSAAISSAKEKFNQNSIIRISPVCLMPERPPTEFRISSWNTSKVRRLINIAKTKIFL